MYLSVKGGVAVLIFTFIIIGIAMVTPSQEKRSKTDEKVLGDSFFVSGTRGDTPQYQSITPLETRSEERETLESTSLFDFLNIHKKTAVVTRGNVEASSEVVAALKRYGNEVGEIIRTYSDESRDEADVLQLFVTEPGNAKAKEELLSLANEYVALSEKLHTINPPPLITEAHERFAGAHKNVGNGMEALMSGAFSVENFSSYNERVASFTDAYVSVAQTLRSYGVFFETSEPGSLFTLPF